MKKTNMSLELHFSEHESVELTRTVFRHEPFETPIVGMRGYSVPSGVIPFRWGTTLHAVALFFVKATLIESEEQIYLPILEGKKRCPASVIARLLFRHPENSCMDIFGADASGRPLLSRMIVTYNPFLKHAGPIQTLIRHTLLSPQSIRIFFNGRDITKNRKMVALLATNLEKSWKPGSQPNPNTRKAKLIHEEILLKAA